MSNSWFQFKQFCIHQGNTPMKVGTDGVLLGAWADYTDSLTDKDYSILDIGAGTGLISLMAAQRSNAVVWAIEIDSAAAKQAQDNFELSPWKNRINIICGDIIINDAFTNMKFNHIVCNPPFFKNDLHSPEQRRNQARHDSSLPIDELVFVGSELLKKNGSISIILPLNRFDEANSLFEDIGLFLSRKCTVSSRYSGKVIRVIAAWSVKKSELSSHHLNIYMAESNVYHQDFIDLTKEFYLDF